MKKVTKEQLRKVLEQDIRTEHGKVSDEEINNMWFNIADVMYYLREYQLK